MADEVHGLRTGMDSRFAQTDKRFERVEHLPERPATSISEFGNMHREPVNAQTGRIGSLERRVNRWKGKN